MWLLKLLMTVFVVVGVGVACDGGCEVVVIPWRWREGGVNGPSIVYTTSPAKSCRRLLPHPQHDVVLVAVNTGYNLFLTTDSDGFCGWVFFSWD